MGTYPPPFHIRFPSKDCSSRRKSTSAANDSLDQIQLLCFHPFGGIRLHSSDTYTSLRALFPPFFAPMTTLKLQCMARVYWIEIIRIFVVKWWSPLKFRITLKAFLLNLGAPLAFRTKIETFSLYTWDSNILPLLIFNILFFHSWIETPILLISFRKHFGFDSFPFQISIAPFSPIFLPIPVTYLSLKTFPSSPPILAGKEPGIRVCHPPLKLIPYFSAGYYFWQEKT